MSEICLGFLKIFFWRQDFSLNLRQELPLFMRPQGRVGRVSVSVGFGPGHLMGRLQRILVSACSQLFHVCESRTSPFLDLGSDQSGIQFGSTAVTL